MTFKPDTTFRAFNKKRNFYFINLWIIFSICNNASTLATHTSNYRKISRICNIQSYNLKIIYQKHLLIPDKTYLSLIFISLFIIHLLTKFFVFSCVLIAIFKNASNCNKQLWFILLNNF